MWRMVSAAGRGPRLRPGGGDGSPVRRSLKLGGLGPAAGIGEAGILLEAAATPRLGTAPKSLEMLAHRVGRCFRDARWMTTRPPGLVDHEARPQRVEVGAAKNSLIWTQVRTTAPRRPFSSSSKILGAGSGTRSATLAAPELAEALESAMAHALVGRQVGFLELIDRRSNGQCRRPRRSRARGSPLQDIHDVQARCAAVRSTLQPGI